jgi:hypothetical protein
VPQAAPGAQGRPDVALRERILSFLIERLTSEELSKWLRDLKVYPKGTVEEKRQRVRQHTEFLTMPTKLVIDQVVVYRLMKAGARDTVDLCRLLGLPADDGPKPQLLRRLHRHISEREGELPRRGVPPTLRDVLPIIDWYPIYESKANETAYYDEFQETMVDVFDRRYVERGRQGLEIDFRIGDVGVELKMPSSKGDVDRACTQIEGYRTHYRDSLLVMILPPREERQEKYRLDLQGWLQGRLIAHVVKTHWNDALPE